MQCSTITSVPVDAVQVEGNDWLDMGLHIERCDPNGVAVNRTELSPPQHQFALCRAHTNMLHTLFAAICKSYGRSRSAVCSQSSCVVLAIRVRCLIDENAAFHDSVVAKRRDVGGVFGGALELSWYKRHGAVQERRSQPARRPAIVRLVLVEEQEESREWRY